MVGVLGAVLVDADDDVLAAVDARLAARRRLFDAQLRHTGRDCLGHAAELLDLFDKAPRLLREVVRERFEVVRARQRVDDVGHARLLGEDELRVAGDAGRRVGGQAERFVERVGVQALRAP